MSVVSLHRLANLSPDHTDSRPRMWSVAHQRHLPLPALIYQTFDKSGQVEVDAFGGGPGPKFGPMGPDLGPGAQIWGAPGPGPFFSARIFLETRARILTRPTFKKKLPLQASRPFPEGAPRKVSMFKIYLAGRSSDMSVSCPETIFFSSKLRDYGCGFFRLLIFQGHKLLVC